MAGEMNGLCIIMKICLVGRKAKRNMLGGIKVVKMHHVMLLGAMR